MSRGRSEIRPFPRSRRVVMDIGRASRRRHPMHGLIEVDVTPARDLISRREEATGEGIHTLDAVVGGIVERPGIVDGRIVPRELLDLTLSFDHDVVDGAPAARFTAKLRELIESADGLEGTAEIPATVPARVGPRSL